MKHESNEKPLNICIVTREGVVVVVVVVYHVRGTKTLGSLLNTCNVRCTSYLVLPGYYTEVHISHSG